MPNCTVEAIELGKVGRCTIKASHPMKAEQLVNENLPLTVCLKTDSARNGEGLQSAMIGRSTCRFGGPLPLYKQTLMDHYCMFANRAEWHTFFFGGPSIGVHFKSMGLSIYVKFAPFDSWHRCKPISKW